MNRQIDQTLSQRVAELIDAQPYRCWYNARKALLLLPGLLFLATYVEGWLVASQQETIQVVEHGWCTLTDGTIVDPSIVLLEENHQELSYFAGLRLSRPLVQELLPHGMQLPLARLLSHRSDGLGHSGYRTAYEAALAYAASLAVTTGKQVQLCPRETTMAILTEQGLILYHFKE